MPGINPNINSISRPPRPPLPSQEALAKHKLVGTTPRDISLPNPEKTKNLTTQVESHSTTTPTLKQLAKRKITQLGSAAKNYLKKAYNHKKDQLQNLKKSVKSAPKKALKLHQRNVERIKTVKVIIQEEYKIARGNSDNWRQATGQVIQAVGIATKDTIKEKYHEKFDDVNIKQSLKNLGHNAVKLHQRNVKKMQKIKNIIKEEYQIARGNSENRRQAIGQVIKAAGSAAKDAIKEKYHAKFDKSNNVELLSKTDKSDFPPESTESTESKES